MFLSRQYALFCLVFVYKSATDCCWVSPVFRCAYPLLRTSGCSAPAGVPSVVKCLRSSLASSKAKVLFWLSLGPSRLSLDPGPNKPNLKQMNTREDQKIHCCRTILEMIEPGNMNQWHNNVNLLFCALFCRFSMLWSTLLSGQSACW